MAKMAAALALSWRGAAAYNRAAAKAAWRAAASNGGGESMAA
jgi:hypothetical protein